MKIRYRSHELSETSVRDNFFSTYAKFSEKLSFLPPSYALESFPLCVICYYLHNLKHFTSGKVETINLEPSAINLDTVVLSKKLSYQIFYFDILFQSHWSKLPFNPFKKWYRNQSIHVHCKLVEWFLYDRTVGLKQC